MCVCVSVCVCVNRQAERDISIDPQVPSKILQPVPPPEAGRAEGPGIVVQTLIARSTVVPILDSKTSRLEGSHASLWKVLGRDNSGSTDAAVQLGSYGGA